jgi:hypothetical protein
VTSADPTDFASEGLGTSTALDVNPLVGCARLVPGRMPQVNDYICELIAAGAGAENPNSLGVQYTGIISRIWSQDEATRAGRLDLATVDPANNGGSGTFACASIIKGLFLAGAQGDVPGGDCGAYCINTSHIAINGVDVTSALVRLIASVDPAAPAKIRGRGRVGGAGGYRRDPAEAFNLIAAPHISSLVFGPPFSFKRRAPPR